MSDISKNSVITFLSQLLIFVLGLAISIILARSLGPTSRGIYALIVLVPKLMFKFGSLGIEAANIYFTGSKRYEIKDIVSNSLLCSVLFGFGLILLFFGISHLDIFKDFLNDNQINSFYLWIVVLTVPFYLLFIFFRNILLGNEKIITFNKINIFKNIFQLIAVIVFLVILKHGVFGAVFSYVLTIIGVTLLVYLLIRKISNINLSFNRRLFKDAAKYGVKAYIANATQFLNYRLDIFLVAVFLAPAAIGYYSIAVAVAEQLWMIPGAIATVLFPRVSSIKETEANDLTSRFARHTFLIMFVISIIMAFLAKPLILLFFGADYLSSIVPLLILLPGIIALGVSKTLTADLAGRGKPQFAAYSSFASLSINVPLNLYLIPKWGLSGPAF